MDAIVNQCAFVNNRFQYWFINCSKYNAPIQDVNNRESCVGDKKGYMETILSPVFL